MFCLQDIIQKADSNDNQEMDFGEFSKYMQEHERQLKLAFSDLDRNKDGKSVHFYTQIFNEMLHFC